MSGEIRAKGSYGSALPLVLPNRNVTLVLFVYLTWHVTCEMPTYKRL